MEILMMNEAHVPLVAQLEAVCFSDPWSERSVASELNNRLSLWLVAMDNGTLAGYVGSQTVIDETDMMNIAVAPQYRRSGVAQQLIQQLLTELGKRGSRGLMLEVRESNLPARNLYEKLGFVQVGKRPKYYRNPKEDALILRKEIHV